LPEGELLIRWNEGAAIRDKQIVLCGKQCPFERY
jgi:hypothetical protein